ncbi:MAG TPA: hypothetical protein PK205_13470 [Promineifilum sp.]|nr:hypothetical protein [Promineifilum sp.]HRQ14310.1 hypothetical protein [Promineifilum sp.]
MSNREPLAVRHFSAASSRLSGSDLPWIAAVLLFALVAAWPAISQPGLLNTRGGGDSPFLLQRLHQLATALADGHFPVRWMPDANYGYGYPFYNYYAPLSIYIAAAFRFLGFSFVRAIHLAQLAGFAVAGLGMFYLGRRWLGSRWAGLLAAVAYTVAPFHMVNVYTRGDSLAEFWAMAFYPLILLAADGLFGEGEKGRGGERGKERGGERGKGRKGEGEKEHPFTPSPLRPRPIALFALAYAALILSHNISALIFSPFLVLYLAIRLFAARQKSRGAGEQGSREAGALPFPLSPFLPFSPALPALAGILLAFALAAWFFVPALAEQGLAQLGPVTEGYFHFSNHFRGLDLLQTGLLFNYNPDGGAAFRLGLAQVGLAIAGAAAWLLRKGTTDHRPQTTGHEQSKATGFLHSSFVTRHSSFVILSALIAVFMITPLSRPLWDHLPLLPFTQFPWRFLSVASFFLALLSGGLVPATDRPAGRAAIAVTGSLVLLAAGLLGLRVDHLILTDADVTAERLAQYEWFTGNIGTTVSGEYLTPESSPRPWASAWLNAAERDRVVALSGELSAELIDRRAARQTWRLVAGEGGAEARFPTMQWPGWRATLDGQAATLRAVPSSGLMALTVPAGEHTVTLALGPTPVRRAAELVSLLAAVVVVGLAVIDRRRPTGGRQRATLWSVVCSLLLFLALAILWRNDPAELPRGDLTWDFAQMGYLHHTPGGVPFGDGSKLHEYGYSGDVITAGGTLTVTLSITAGDAGTATLALVTPAVARPVPDGAAEPPTIAAQTIGLDRETAVFTLPIPSNAPAGLYVPRLVLDGARSLTPSGATRGDLFLRPIRLVANDAPLTTPNPAIDAEAVDIALRDASTLDGRFRWQTAAPFAGRYQVSWRAQNGDGAVLSQLDAQPGYGFNPTDGWAADGTVFDWLALRLPAALAGPPPYPLVMVLYDVTTGEQLLARRTGRLVESGGRIIYQPDSPVFAPPDGLEPFEATFGNDGSEFIRLLGFEAAQTGSVLELTLYWQAMGSIPADFTRFVHLIDASGAPVAQVDGRPVANSYPTDQWTDGEVVADTVRIDLSILPSGEYRLATGFYRPAGDLSRLDAATPDGPLPDGRAVLPWKYRLVE